MVNSKYPLEYSKRVVVRVGDYNKQSKYQSSGYYEQWENEHDLDINQIIIHDKYCDWISNFSVNSNRFSLRRLKIVYS